MDAALRDGCWRPHGDWEAKDTGDDLEAEARKKFDLRYPRDNRRFLTPRRALLFDNDTPAFDADLTNPAALIEGIQSSFSCTPPAYTV